MLCRYGFGVGGEFAEASSSTPAEMAEPKPEVFAQRGRYATLVFSSQVGLEEESLKIFLVNAQTRVAQ